MCLCICVWLPVFISQPRNNWQNSVTQRCLRSPFTFCSVSVCISAPGVALWQSGKAVTPLLCRFSCPTSSCYEPSFAQKRSLSLLKVTGSNCASGFPVASQSLFLCHRYSVVFGFYLQISVSKFFPSKEEDAQNPIRTQKWWVGGGWGGGDIDMQVFGRLPASQSRLLGHVPGH